MARNSFNILVTETDVDENSALDAGNVTQCAESIQNSEKQISPHTESGLCRAKVSPIPELCLACWQRSKLQPFWSPWRVEKIFGD